ncbi:caseinolytic protease [Hordeum vulgare]|nr:caseinolytic protease [Hordeum vulgare]
MSEGPGGFCCGGVRLLVADLACGLEMGRPSAGAAGPFRSPRYGCVRATASGSGLYRMLVKSCPRFALRYATSNIHVLVCILLGFGIDKSKMHQGRNIHNSKSSTDCCCPPPWHPIKEEAPPGTKVHNDPTTPKQAKLTPCMALYDTMVSLKSPIGTRCVGFAFNLDGFILAAGEKGSRTGMPLCRVSLQSPAGAARGQDDDIENESNELNRIKNYLYGKLAKHTGQSVEKVSIFC